MQVQEGGIKRLILLSSTLVVITITTIVGLFLVTTENKNFKIEVQRIEEELITNKKRNLENQLQNLINEISFDQELMKQLQLDELEAFVNTLYISVKNSSQKDAKEVLQRYDLVDTMHAFAFYADGTIFWNPRNPKTEGINYLQAQDINDQFYIKKMIEIAKSRKKDNTIKFSWYIPADTTISTNVAFVKYIPHLDLVIGAYRSEKSIDNWTQKTILQKINSHEFWKESLFFIDHLESYTMQGEYAKALLHLGNPNYLQILKEPKTQQAIAKSFLDEGFLGNHALTISNDSHQYLMYTTIMPKWRWIVGIGENLQELTKIKNAQLKRAIANRDIKVMQLIALSLIVAGIFLVLSKFLAQAIETLLLNYRQRADMESEKYQALYTHSNDSFILAREDGFKIIDANPRALSLTALKLEELSDKYLTDFFPELDFDAMKSQDSGYKRTSFISNNLEKKTVELTFVWVVIRGKKVIFISIRDITERMKLVSERQKHEQLLIQQSKMAAMGEMLGNIAHQWRQPLSHLSGIFMDLESAYLFGELNQKYIQNSVGEANDTIEYMSSTIDDFINFFNPNKPKEYFPINRAINRAIKIIHSSLEFHNISLHVNVKGEFKIYGYENEYAQVVLNIISNAKDILVEKKVANPEIKITLFLHESRTCLSVQDNAGGIPDENKTKIFEPYFTTKHGYGAGIGLYMSKIIIEKNMNGQIQAENIDGGAKFTICL